MIGREKEKSSSECWGVVCGRYIAVIRCWNLRGQIVDGRLVAVHRMMQPHLAVGSCSSRCRPSARFLSSSSSSTMSWGRTVICTTFLAVLLNLHSIMILAFAHFVNILARRVFGLGRGTCLPAACCPSATSQSISGGYCLDCSALPPTPRATLAESTP